MAINTLSIPNKLGNNGGRQYSYANRPVLIDCHFQVAASDSGGLGIINLSGQGVNTVFMYTSASAGVGPNGLTNPMAHNASKGYIQLQLQNNYKHVLSVSGMIQSPTTGSAVNVDASDALLTIGTAYIITSVGTSTQADWQTLGLPIGVVPAVGCSFIALATGAGTGSGQVKAVGSSGVFQVEMVGSPDANLSPIPTNGISPNVGGTILLQALNASDALVEVADGSVIFLQIYVAA